MLFERGVEQVDARPPLLRRVRVRLTTPRVILYPRAEGSNRERLCLLDVYSPRLPKIPVCLS